ncbi:AAEL017069-PA [Aedes aegypti]|uniref:AAEL017069-PA n=2 Tax=Aedes aegypti TaxID=7159 RepID=A0A1S4G538_AEDAE|nr:uncharacterized protein LOC23687489 [Aedes aegypti]EJY57356.1 AAEL017069-PA [Aedes aegypti]
MHRKTENVFVAAVAILCCSVYSAALGDEERKSILTVNDEDHQQQNLSLLKQRIQTCMDRLDGNIESSQVLIHTLLQQLNLGDPRRTSVVEDAEATVQLVRIQTTDDRGMLIWTSNGFYISLSFILFLHLMILIVFGLISLCLSKTAASVVPRVNV